jgi:hypothetical protein
VVAVAAAGFELWLTTDRFFISRGSDIAVEIYTVSPLTKVLTLTVVAGAWTCSMISAVESRMRWILRAGGLIALALATHSIVFSGLDCTVQEHWFNWRLSRATYDCDDGLAKDWAARQKPFFVELVSRHTGEIRVIFTGIPPWSLDLEPTLGRVGD